MNQTLEAIKKRLEGEMAIAIFFAVALYVTWCFLIQGHGDNFLGSDSFIIVSKIHEFMSLRWFEQTYTSQLGIQGILLAGVHDLLPGASTQNISLVAASIISAITAITFAMAVPKIYRLAGTPGVVAYWLALALSPWTLTFSYSLYWVPFTIMLPFMLMLNKGNFWHEDKGVKAFAIVFLAMFLKCLCGYEYITTVTLFACAGYVFSCAANGKDVKIKHLALIFAACIAGFLAAILLHVIQLHSINDSLGFNTILNRAETHTGANSDDKKADILIAHLASRPGNESLISLLSSDLANHKLLFAVTAFKEYFYLPAVQFAGISLPFNFFALIASLASLVWLPRLFMKDKTATKAQSVLSFGALLIVAGVFSWQILAWRHMVLHYHLNGQLFAYGIVPLAAVTVGLVISRLLESKMESLRPSLIYPELLLIVIAICGFSYSAKPTVEDVQTCSITCGRVVGHVDLITLTDTLTEMDRGMGIPSTQITISGWASSLSGEKTKVYVFVKNKLVDKIEPDTDRPDVTAAVPGVSKRSGFLFNYVASGKISKSDIHVIAPDGNGRMYNL